MHTLPTQTINGKTQYTFGWAHRDDEFAQNGVTHKHFASPQTFAAWLTTAHTAAQLTKTWHYETREVVEGYYTKYKVTKQVAVDNKTGQIRKRYSEPTPPPERGHALLKDGDTKLVQKSKDFMDKIQASLPTTVRQWAQAPVGFFPNVPAYLSGEPENMFTIARENSDNSPVRIWVNVLPSGGVHGDALMLRGAVLVALVNLLMQRRSAVRITCYGDQPAEKGKGVIVSWDLPTSPLILSQLCTSLGYPEVVQGIVMHAARTIDDSITGGWLDGHCPGYSYDEAKIRTHLGAEPDDVIIPAAFLKDDLHNKPVEFLHRELTRILGESDSY